MSGEVRYSTYLIEYYLRSIILYHSSGGGQDELLRLWGPQNWKENAFFGVGQLYYQW